MEVWVVLQVDAGLAVPGEVLGPGPGAGLPHLRTTGLASGTWPQAGVATSQKCILVHGQVVLKKYLSVPMHYLSELL